jgi:hypothetical protein
VLGGDEGTEGVLGFYTHHSAMTDGEEVQDSTRFRRRRLGSRVVSAAPTRQGRSLIVPPRDVPARTPGRACLPQGESGPLPPGRVTRAWASLVAVDPERPEPLLLPLPGPSRRCPCARRPIGEVIAPTVSGRKKSGEVGVVQDNLSSLPLREGTSFTYGVHTRGSPVEGER